MSAVLDTHAAIWYVFVRKRLSQDALRFIRRAVDSGRPVYVSAISIVETIMRIMPVDLEVAQAVYKVPRAIVPDMPDRITAATALHLNLPLITRDARLQSAGIQTMW
jgi:PIN domain nuclease of toxin-antitoxin system